MRLAFVTGLLIVAAPAGVLADDAPPTAVDPATPNITPAQLSAFLIVDVPAPPPPSLRLEAVRAINENWENSWRYPQPGALFGVDSGLWFAGNGYYHPRTLRSAALHGGAIGSTLAGQILLGADSPLLGVGALLTGAVLDAAAADVDRDAESRRGR